MTFDLALFLGGTFAASFVTGLAGFAFGMVAAGIWLYVLTPVETSMLIAAYALLIQGHAVWKLRHSVKLHRLKFLILGTAAGVPVGIAALRGTSPVHLRVGFGILLVLFSLYGLARPRLPEMKRAARSADTGIGFLNGIIGGATGLGGILPTIWGGLRGGSRDEQRAVFQPTAVATFLMIIVASGSFGTITLDMMRLFLVGLPALIVGSWFGWMLYGKLDEAAFRKIVLALLLGSGIKLIASP
jgi:uncharacterized membrane protein YfcA